MTVFGWIVLAGVIMSAIALIGSITLLLSEKTLQKILLPLVALAAGSLIGGSFFHMLPTAIENIPNTRKVFLWVTLGFSVFLALEQFLHWHHCHRNYVNHPKPSTYLILLADGIHNFIGGLAVGSAFVIDIPLGVTTWLMAVTHEIPQELGDFAALVHDGWEKRKALVYNVLSGLTFLVGGMIAYAVSPEIKIDFLIPFAAGNFIYIGASDLIPQVNKTQNIREGLATFLMFCLGALIIFLLGEKLN